MRRVVSGLAAVAVMTSIALLAPYARADSEPDSGPSSTTGEGAVRTTISPNSGMGPGTASTPHDGARTQLQPQSGAVVQASGFHTTGVRIFPLAAGSRPYEGQPVLPLGGTGVVDAQGVRMFRIAGDPTLWNHPAAQAQYALANLDSYRTTHNNIYLDRAIANAQRLVDTRVESGNAWFYPYKFKWTLYGTTTLRPSWFSGIAQGQALSAFVRLFEVTQDPQWRTAADATFASLDQQPVAGSPFASWVDSASHLWLEEYPQPDIVSSEKVLNGHLFASFGLVDYWNLTHDPRAALLFDGAVTTIQDTALTGFRHPGAPSSYSLRHQRSHARYHHTHVLQFRFLYQLTHRGLFVADANIYRSDWPKTWSAGRGFVTPTVRRIFMVNQGAVSRTRSIALKKRLSVRFDSRVRVPGKGVLIRLASSKYAGWYVRERYGRAWIGSPTDSHFYAPRKVSVGFLPGKYIGYRYWSSGIRRSTRVVSFRQRSTAPSGESAIIGGQSAFLFTSGTWAGYWVPLQRGMVYG